MEFKDFELLVEEARGYCRARLEQTRTNFGLGTHRHFHLDLEKGLLDFFGAEGALCVCASIQVAGTWSPRDETWLWSWENDSIPPVSRERVDAVRKFGLREEMPMLQGSFTGGEAEAWAMTAVAGKLLGAEGFYRVPGATSHVFLLLFSLTRIS